MNYMLELDYSCGRGPDPVGDKSGRGTKWPHGPFWTVMEESSSKKGRISFSYRGARQAHAGPFGRSAAEAGDPKWIIFRSFFDQK